MHNVLLPSCRDKMSVGLQDLQTNPLIVPVKILRGHQQQNHEGVLCCTFHPSQPWIFTCGADGEVALHGN